MGISSVRIEGRRETESIISENLEEDCELSAQTLQVFFPEKLREGIRVHGSMRLDFFFALSRCPNIEIKNLGGLFNPLLFSNGVLREKFS